VVSESKWERYAASGGIIFIVLSVVALIVLGSPPKPSDSTRKIVDWFADNEDEIKIAGFLQLLAFVPILWWSGSLWARLRRAEGGETRLALVALGGLFVTGGLVGAGAAVMGTENLRLADLDPGQVRFVYGLSQGLLAAASFPLAVLVAATSVVALRTSVFPKWLGWAGLVLALLWLVAGCGVVDDSDGIFVVGFVAFFAWLVWIFILSIIMMRPTRSPSGPQGAPNVAVNA
jgi:hypothetical protein